MGQLLGKKYYSETFYRSRRPGQGPAWIDLGVLVKPLPDMGYRRRVTNDHLVVIFLLRGTGMYVDGDGRSHRLHPGDLVPHVPGRSHSMVPDGDGQWVEFFLQVPGAFFRALSEMGHLPADDGLRHVGLRRGLIHGIDGLMDAAAFAEESDAPALLQQAHVLLNQFYAPARASVAGETHQAAIDAACEALSGLRDVDLRSLAESHGLSYERLRKLFRQAVGLPPGEYRIRRRIDRARAMIAEQGLSTKAVAFALGYPDPFTFSKQFKKYVGVSPTTFRKQL